MMKKEFILIFLLCVFITHAQEVSVVKNRFGVQVGFPNLASFQYETKLARTITLYNEVGLNLFTSTIEFKDTDKKDKIITGIAPFITITPRWYYSLDRRSKKGKNIQNNSSNFIAINTSYIGASIPINQNDDDYNIASALLIMPTYGIRRSIAKHFFYEMSLSVGYQYNIFNEDNCNCDHHNVNGDLQINVGYNF